MSSRIDGSLVQLHRFRARIENVLKGSVGDQTILVYYFGIAGGFDGPRPLGFGGTPSRRILWIRMDNGAYRMACDIWDNCSLFVTSGAHPGYEASPSRPLEYALADILLTRGAGAINSAEFAREVASHAPYEGTEGYAIDKLKNLAITESSAIRSSACEQLWIYTQDRIGESLRERARQSLQAAGCNCRLKPDQNILCE